MPPPTNNVPLRIAFFGSDHFSCESLKRLHQFLIQTNQVETLHLVTRSIKPTGRKLKQFIEYPVAIEASKLNIPVHRVDTSPHFHGLQSYNFNMAIAVSFGKLIPRHFLESLQFGGLNVHPSLLPKYSGASPIQYALMNDDKYTGVTVQTLHPTKFDGGDILLQSDEIPIDPEDNYSSLEKKLGEVGGSLLVQTLREKRYLDPKPIRSLYSYSYAQKITPKDAEIKWSNTARQIKRKYDALGKVYTWKWVEVKKKNLKEPVSELHRVILDGLHDHRDNYGLTEPGSYVFRDDRLYIKTAVGTLSVNKIKQQYHNEETAQSYCNRWGTNGFFQSP